MTEWTELVRTGLVGTERNPWTTPADSHILKELGQSAEAPEHHYLRSVALMYRYREAGQSLGISPPSTAAPAPAEEWARCGPRTASYFRTLLQNESSPLLAEAARLLARTERRLVEELLPTLLVRGASQPALRSALHPVAGQRGRWLARIHPDGQWFDNQALAAQTDWMTATMAERQILLAYDRQHDPARGRERLHATWQQDSADQRGQLLELLRTNLSITDEPFLENALADRSQVVRRGAANLLADLPESQLQQRLWSQAAPLLEIVKEGLIFRKLLVEIHPLESLPPELERDGIARKSVMISLGERAWWTLQLVSLIPPQRWCEQFQLSAGQLVEANQSREWRDLLLSGWAKAAVRHQAADWAAALLPQLVTNDEQYGNLLAMLPACERENVLLDLLAKAEPLNVLSVGRLLTLHTHWTCEFTRTVWKHLARMCGAVESSPVAYFAMSLIPIISQLPRHMGSELPDHVPGLASLRAALQLRDEVLDAIERRE